MPRGSVALLAAFTLLVLAQNSEGCTCIPRHPQRQFCDSDFVIRGRVIAVKNIPFPGNSAFKEKRYTVKVLDVFRGNCKRYKKIFIYTAFSDGLCGASLTLKRVYLISGRVNNKQYSFTVCDWFSQWKDLSRAQMNMLRKGVYAKNCACGKKIVTCLGGKCPKGTPIHGVCKWFVGSPGGTCKAKYAWCGASGRGCRWFKRYGWRRCRWPNAKIHPYLGFVKKPRVYPVLKKTPVHVYPAKGKGYIVKGKGYMG